MTVAFCAEGRAQLIVGVLRSPGPELRAPRVQQRQSVPMDDKYDPRIVFDDARARHASVVALIMAKEVRALALLRIYVTIGVAAAAGAIGVFFTSPSAATLPRPAGWALVAVVFTLSAGSFACFRAMRSDPVNLPGRLGDFWLGAIDPARSTAEVLTAYLTNLNSKSDQNDELNKRLAKWLDWAKWAGMLTPIAALLTGVLAAALGRS